MPTPWNSTPGRRVALVAGVRTPFAKAGTALRHLSVVDLGRAAVAELVQRTALDGRTVDLLTFGTVIPSVLAPNPAREVALLPHFPRTLQAHTVSRACASANQAITDAADQIALGHADVAIAGGAESLSQVPILHSRRMSDLLVKLSRARSVGERLALLGTLRPRDFVPVTPAIAEPSTGESMGQSAERMAKLNGITREAQDA
ncbi:MAG: acetyl-CoA C-acyltransferase, partial [Gemmatimonadetes bacterium]|nr:acetyl-CoA C-acyltransferase [Gemmatimonadota bacterium]